MMRVRELFTLVVVITSLIGLYVLGFHWPWAHTLMATFLGTIFVMVSVSAYLDVVKDRYGKTD